MERLKNINKEFDELDKVFYFEQGVAVKGLAEKAKYCFKSSDFKEIKAGFGVSDRVTGINWKFKTEFSQSWDLKWGFGWKDKWKGDIYINQLGWYKASAFLLNNRSALDLVLTRNSIDSSFSFGTAKIGAGLFLGLDLKTQVLAKKNSVFWYSRDLWKTVFKFSELYPIAPFSSLQFSLYYRDFHFWRFGLEMIWSSSSLDACLITKNRLADLGFNLKVQKNGFLTLILTKHYEKFRVSVGSKFDIRGGGLAAYTVNLHYS